MGKLSLGVQLRADLLDVMTEYAAFTEFTTEKCWANECVECGSCACICQFEVEVERLREDLTVTSLPVS